MDLMNHYLETLRSEGSEDAFFRLLELAEATVPALWEVYRTEQDGQIRAVIVKLIWQHRQATSIPYLAESLIDSEPEVWKQALDGLVTLNIADARMILEEAIQGQIGQDPTRRAWIEEAIVQMANVAQIDAGE